jgi:hypothetical protein
MGEFEEREQSFEAKFAHEQEMLFKARARRDALAARWVASQLGFSGPEAEAYVQSLVELAVRKDHDQSVVQKILGDFESRRLPMSEHRLRKQLADLLDQAMAQVKSEVRS